jgi:hypothetical protein
MPAEPIPTPAAEEIEPSPLSPGVPSDRGLRLLLRVLGTIDALALLAVAMPEASMARVHEFLQLGELPATPLVGYLTRSASLLYAMHGAMIVFISFDTPRYRPLIRFLAWAAVAHGSLLVLIDWREAMPPWWTLLEGPFYLITGLAVLRLLKNT